MYALAPAATAPKTGHVRFCCGFVDEYKPPRIATREAGRPLLSAYANVRPVLFAGRQRFFLGCSPGERLPAGPP